MTGSGDAERLEVYAKAVAEMKGAENLDDEALEALRGRLSEGLDTVYRAVALDIDGTLTQPPSVALDRDIVALIRRLLQKGVPVVFITGRGRSARLVVETLLADGLSRAYLRRLYCIIHNGSTLLETLDTPGAEPLASELSLVEGVDAESLKAAVERLVTVPPSLTDSSIRLVYSNVDERDAELRVLRERSDELAAAAGKPLYLASGTYSVDHTIDIAATTKKEALEALCRRIGISPGSVLRIGDQGAVGGNDFELLDCPQGFCVGAVSGEIGHCHPVLNERQEQLWGVEATLKVLDVVKLRPRLRLEPDTEVSNEVLKSLRQIERVARQMAGPTRDELTAQIGRRFAALLGPLRGLAGAPAIELSDLVDPHSGAIRFRDWELDELDLESDHPAMVLFELEKFSVDEHVDEAPQGRYAMYADTGVLLRGSNYYFGVTVEKSESRVQDFLNVSADFIRQAGEACAALGEASPSLERYKLTLGIADNVRNILLQMGFLGFLVDETRDDRFVFTQGFVEEWLVGHTRSHVELLATGLTDWKTAHAEYSDLLLRLDSVFQDWSGQGSIFAETKEDDGKSIFRPRECDNLIESLIAVRLGLRKHAQQLHMPTDQVVVAVGLIYGGIELPILAAVVAPDLELRAIPAFARVSLYEDAELGARYRTPTPGYVQTLIENTPIFVAAGGDLDRHPVFVLDDNCTTAKTLEVARDLLVAQGAEVVGALVVRYPSTNRSVQMKMPEHGVPDPEVLLSFIRGLVSPSPYTRLIHGGPEGDGDRYKDVDNVFDKSKARLEHLLKANGTPRV